MLVDTRRRAVKPMSVTPDPIRFDNAKFVTTATWNVFLRSARTHLQVVHEAERLRHRLELHLGGVLESDGGRGGVRPRDEGAQGDTRAAVHLAHVHLVVRRLQHAACTHAFLTRHTQTTAPYRDTASGAGFMNRRRLRQLTAAILTSDLTTRMRALSSDTQRLSCNYTGGELTEFDGSAHVMGNLTVSL